MRDLEPRTRTTIAIEKVNLETVTRRLANKPDFAPTDLPKEMNLGACRVAEAGRALTRRARWRAWRVTAELTPMIPSGRLARGVRAARRVSAHRRGPRAAVTAGAPVASRMHDGVPANDQYGSELRDVERINSVATEYAQRRRM